MMLHYIRDQDSYLFMMPSKVLLIMGQDVTSAITSIVKAEGWRKWLKMGHGGMAAFLRNATGRCLSILHLHFTGQNVVT